MNTIRKMTGVMAPALAPSKDLRWGYLTVESEDSDGDIVRVKGMDYATYHNPPTRYIKVLANHARMLADGTPAVIGRIEQIVETRFLADGKDVPALAFGWSAATDKEGVMTPLAKAYADLYDGGYLDSFSAGFLSIDAKPLGKGRGVDYTKTVLTEVSAATIPANARANAIVRRTLQEVGVRIPDTEERLAAIEMALLNMTDKFSADMQTRLVEKMTKVFEDRFDDFIGTYVSKSKRGTATGDATGALPKLDVDTISRAILASIESKTKNH